MDLRCCLEALTSDKLWLGFSSGLNWALALKGVIATGKALSNLNPSELKQHCAIIMVTNHLSSVPSIFVRDGALSSSPNCDAKAISVEYQAIDGFVAADIERSSVDLCDKAFSDAGAIKKALYVLSEPVISARGGTPLPGRMLLSGDYVFVLIASDDTIQSSECIPSVSKLSPGQAAYHFLAGYQNGNFVPSFYHGPSCIDPLELAKAL